MKKLALISPVCLLAIGLGCKQQAKPTVDSVVAKMTEALGGAEKLASVTDRVEDWEFTMYQMPPDTMSEMPSEMGEPEMAVGEGEEEGAEEGMAPMTMDMVISCKRPNKLRFDFKEPDGTVFMASFFDGTRAWEMQMGQLTPATEEQVWEWQDMGATWLDGFHNYAEKGYTLELLPNETVDGTEYIVLKSTSKHGIEMMNYVNATTYFVEKQTGMRLNMAKEMEKQTLTMTDWKMVDGLALGHHVTSYDSKGEKVWDAKLLGVETNVGVDDAIFSGGTNSSN